MKKTGIGFILASVLLSSITLSPVSVDAITSGVSSKDATSTVEAELTAPKPTEHPQVDPNNPSEITDITHNVGNLTIDSAPSLKFAKTEIGSDGQPQVIGLEAAAQKGLQVTDVRGTNAGWSVSAALSELVSGSDSLKGASITFRTDGIKTKTTGITAPVVNGTEMELTAGGSAVEFMTAAAGTGMGSWLLAFNGEADPTKGFSLNVPFGVKAGQYTGNITWTLSDTPTAPIAPLKPLNPTS